MAARMMDSAEKSGRKFTASTVSYYAARAARRGQRSYDAGGSDVMSPGCQLDGRARIKSLDDPVEFDTGDMGTIHDVIPAFDNHEHESDPAEEASRNLDWHALLGAHPPRHRTAVLVLVEGGTIMEAGKRCGLKDSAALLLKRRTAADLVVLFGADMIRRLLHGMRPGWESDLRLTRERHLCHVGPGIRSGFGEPG